jgi:hypothetical protein
MSLFNTLLRFHYFNICAGALIASTITYKDIREKKRSFDATEEELDETMFEVVRFAGLGAAMGAIYPVTLSICAIYDYNKYKNATKKD